jgi:CRP/FNR family cyclic AMP-dependent transcriptional regulator
MNSEQLTQRLSTLSFTADLSDQMLKSLASISRAVSYPAGGIVFEERTQHRNLYLIWSGKVALDMEVPGHGNARVLTLGPGDLVGWSAVLDAGEMTASAVALENTELVVLPADKLRDVCHRDSQLGYAIMLRIARQLARRLLATRLNLLNLLEQGNSPASDASRPLS